MNYFYLNSEHLNMIYKVLRRRQWQPTPVLLPGKSHGQRSLVGCSPWGCEESDTTERLHFHFSRSCIGEGNGNPLQCSCLENPRHGGAWWAAISGVAQSRTEVTRQQQQRHDLHQPYGSLVSGQTTGREHSPARQQKIGLNIY